MLIFAGYYGQGKSMANLNTSNVNVNLYTNIDCLLMVSYLNTSNVNVNLSTKNRYNISFHHLNTSNVNVNQPFAILNWL